MGLKHPADLAAWQQWQDRRHPLRLSKTLVRGAARKAARRSTLPTQVQVYRGGPHADLVIAVEATHASVRAAVIDVIPHVDPQQLIVVSATGFDPSLPHPAIASVCDLTDLSDHLGAVRSVLAAGHYSPIGAACFAHASAVGAEFWVSQHGLLTPLAPPLPPAARLLAWSAADAEFWAAGRSDVSVEVVGSQLLWGTGVSTSSAKGTSSTTEEFTTQSSGSATGPEEPVVYLGQLHAAEMSRRGLAQAAGAFCREHDATYRPHPSERDRVSRVLHDRWRRQGVQIDYGSTPLAKLTAPVVSVFSTGVLEAAARGLPAWVDFPAAPAWLEEFWERYDMRQFGEQPTEAPAQPAVEPARAIAESLGAA